MTQAVEEAEDTSLTVSAITGDYAVSSADVESYQKNGHILLKHVCNEKEIAEYRPAIVSAASRLNKETRKLAERDTYGRAFLQTCNLWAKDELVRPFTLAHRFGKIAAELMGVDAVRIYHDQALFKEPGGGPTPWHQDQYYWPLDTANTITLWMPLVDIAASMTFGTGSHKHGYVLEKAISDDSDFLLETYIREHDIPLTTYGAMKAGDATFHAGWTLHSAPNNPTSQMREVMTIIYFADGARAIDPGGNKNRASDLAGWLPGIHAGDLAASSLNPIV